MPETKIKTKVITAAPMVIVLAIFIALLATFITAPDADARIRLTAKWEARNSAKSYTGAIFHAVKNGELQDAVTVEPGEEKLIKLRVDSGDRKVGLMVWQPAHSCVKVYRWTAIVWVRVYKYKPQSRGRDVWVMHGFPSTGEHKWMVKILRSC